MLSEQAKILLAENIAINVLPISSSSEEDLLRLRLRKADVLFTTEIVKNPAFVSIPLIESDYCIVCRQEHPDFENLSEGKCWNEQRFCSTLKTDYQTLDYMDVTGDVSKNKIRFGYRNMNAMLRYHIVSKTDLVIFAPTLVAKKMQEIFPISIIPFTGSGLRKAYVYAVILNSLKKDMFIKKFIISVKKNSDKLVLDAGNKQ